MTQKLLRLKDNRYIMMIFPIFIMLLLLIVFGVITKGSFLEPTNIKGIINQSLVVATAAVGVSFIYTSGNIDISIGAVTALSAAIGAVVFNATGSTVLMLLTMIGVAACILMINSNLSIIFNIKPVTVAIVMMLLCNALLSKVLGASDLYVDYDMCYQLESVFRIPAFLVFFGICIVLFHFTRIGRAAKFIGGNENCSEQTGINSAAYIRVCFLIAGVGVGLAAIFTIARTGSISNSTASSLGMDVMLATVLGGMSIFGGHKSNCYSGVIGGILVVALNKGLLMAGVSATIIQGIRGVLFLLMVYLSSERTDTLPSKNQV